MKTFLISFLLVMLSLSACVTNNGDIGPIYGQWSLRQFTVDGVDADVDCDNYFFQFQNNILVIKEMTDNNDYINYYATWTMEDDIIKLNFTHTTDEQPDGYPSYDPPLALGIPIRAVTAMHIRIDSPNMTLSFVNDKGQSIVYRLVKS